MPRNENESYLLNQQVSFIQHFLPGLDAGEYKLELQQQILDSDNNPVKDALYNNQYKFAVIGDRFSLAQPGNVLSSVFPPNNGSGEFGNVLPHVVFVQETFPWMRYPTNELPYQPPNPGTDTDADVPTWLWVMVLDEDDVAAVASNNNSQSLNLTPVTCTIADLFPQAALPPGQTSTLGNNYSYFPPDTQNIKGLEPGQNLSDSIQVIDVPLWLFWQIAPTVDDLRQMAHGRVVSLVHQNTSSGKPDPGEPVGSFSITFANRLPGNNKKSVAFLVSLERMQDFLPDNENGGPPTGNKYSGNRYLRLAVLTNWTFFSDGQAADFVSQLEMLNGRKIDDNQPAVNTDVRLLYSGNNPVVAGALNMGYVPLNETMRTSENNVSWYRGPLVPYYIPDLYIQTPIPSPDAATIFDPTTGMLDTSYAAAWTVGRMLALQDTSFSVPYYNYKRGLEMQVLNSIEESMIESTLGASLNRVDSSRNMKLAATESMPYGSKSLLKRTLLALNPEE